MIVLIGAVSGSFVQRDNREDNEILIANIMVSAR